MDTPGVVVRGPTPAQLARSQRASAGQQATGGSNASSASAAPASGSVLALLGAAAREHHLGSRPQTKQEPERAGTSAGEGAAPGAGAPAASGGEAHATRAAFEARFAETASDHDAFHALMRQSFGEGYDYAAAETIRRQTLAGDFSWMPEIEVVDASVLVDESGTQTGGTALGAYSAETDTIYLSRELLAEDPGRALEILTEEVGHGLDARLNETDSAGDEGEIFARLSAGEELSAEELDALRSENDSGTITVDGKTIEIEYGCNPVKAIGNAFKAIGKAFGQVFDGMMNLLGTILNSPIFQMIMTIAQFIPIPIVQAVVLVVRIVKAAYAVYQGIKHGSMAMVLSGIAGVAAGVAGLGGVLGASQGFIDKANRVAQWASRASKAYTALARQDFGAALDIASEAFSGTGASSTIDTARRAYRAGEAVGRGDVIGGIGLGSDLVGDLTGEKAFSDIAENADTVGSVVAAARSGDYGTAASLLVANYADDVGLDASARARAGDIASALQTADGARRMIADGDYGGAANALLDTAQAFGLDDPARDHLEGAADTVGRIADVAGLLIGGDYAGAIAAGSSLLGDEVDAGTGERVRGLVDFAERAVALKDAVSGGDVAGALGALQEIAGIELPPRIKAIVEGAADFAERAADIEGAVSDGEYARAADLAATLADTVRADDVAGPLRSLAALLERLGIGASTGGEEAVAA